MSVFSVQVTDRSSEGELLTRDVCSRLLEDRIIFMYGELETEMGQSIIAQLLYLTSVSKDPISIYINSDGGLLNEALALHDTIKYIKPIVKTVCIGQACSAAAIILSSGDKGYRVALPSSRVLLHQLRGEISGDCDEMAAYANENKRLMGVVINILANQTGKDVEELKVDLEKEFFMTAEEAVEYGLIDKIVKGNG